MRSTQAVRVVSIADSAIDTVSMGREMMRYAARRDPDLLKLVPGAKATWFHVGRIPRSAFNTYVQDATNDDARFERAFAFGVKKVENLVSHETGETLHSFQPEGEHKGVAGTIKFFTDEQLAHLAPMYTSEIGQFAWWRSFLAPGSEVSLPLLRTLHPVLIQRLSRDVDEILGSAPKSSDEAKGGESPPQTDGDGDAPTAADATG